jgi:hypothetical protein
MPSEGSPGSRSDRNIPSSEGVVVRFSYRMVPEVYQVFWAGMAAGEFINDAAIAAGSYRKQGARWLAAVGGVRPRRGRKSRVPSADAVCRVAYASQTEYLHAVTEAEIRWLDSVLAGLDDGSIIWKPRYCRSHHPSRELTYPSPDDP